MWQFGKLDFVDEVRTQLLGLSHLMQIGNPKRVKQDVRKYGLRILESNLPEDYDDTGLECGRGWGI